MSKTILAIDDDKKFLKILEDALSSKGLDVHTARDGDNGIRKFEKLNPDIVLVDGLLPKMDGFQVCKKIRALPKGKSVPIIMMTAIYKMPAKEREARIQYKVQEYLTKPIDLAELLTLIEKYLN